MNSKPKIERLPNAPFLEEDIAFVKTAVPRIREYLKTQNLKSNLFEVEKWTVNEMRAVIQGMESESS